MPFKPYVPLQPAAVADTSDSSWLGKLRSLGAGATRAISGVASAEGGVTGAGLSGLGELGAEAIEGSLSGQSLPRTIARVGAAGALGAIPFGAVFKAGRPLASAVRGAAYSGGGEALREAAAGEDIQPGTVATSAGLGGLFTGGLAKLLGKSATPTAAKMTYEVVPTAQEGGSVLGGGKVVRGGRNKADILIGAKRMDTQGPWGITGSATALTSEPAIGKAVDKIPYPAAEPPVTPVPPVKISGNATKELLRDQRNLSNTEKWLARTRAAKVKEAGNATTLEDIRAAREAAGVEAQPPTFAESISAKTPEGGRESMRTPWKVPKKASEGEWTELEGDSPPVAESPVLEAPEALAGQSESAAGKVLTPTTATAAAAAADTAAVPMVATEAAPAAAATVENPVPYTLAKFFKTPQGATGLNYRMAKEAEAAGEIPTSAYARDSHLLQLGKPAEGPLAASASEAPLKGSSVPQEETSPVTPTAEAPYWTAKQLGLLDRLKGLANTESGAVNPALLKAGLGLTGAAVGGATDPLDNRWASAAVGGVAGVAGAHALLTSLGAAPHTLENLQENIKTPGGIKNTAKKIWQTLPQIQRFNYLMSGHGIVANSLFGPYGSAMFGALEHGLSGNPAGWKALKTLNPVSFMQEFGKSFTEAADLVGRAEGLPVGMTPTQFAEELLKAATGQSSALPVSLLASKSLEIPGMYMTAGDVAARRILERSGFSPDAARRITLTSEPELRVPRRLAGFSRGSPLAQLLLPFSRTPANILEQGGQRLPGLGFLVQASRAKEGFTPDPMKQQLIQQGLSTAIGLGSGAIGASLDPETAKVVRRYISNLGGQYSLPASMGFTAGQALHEGRPAIPAAITEGVRDMPLPTTQSMESWVKFINDVASGNPAAIPSGVIPAAIRDVLYPTKTANTLGNIPSLRRPQ